MTMYIVPHSGIELVDWSIDRGHPTPVSKRKNSNETLYFVYYSHGIKPDKPWQFYLDFRVQVLVNHKTDVCYTQIAKFYSLKIFSFTVPLYFTIICRWQRKQTWFHKLPCVVTISMVTSTSHHCFSGSWTVSPIGLFQIPGL